MESSRTFRRIRIVLIFFVVALIGSGVTAFPLRWETRLLATWFGEGSDTAKLLPGLAWWLSHVHDGLEATYPSYPFLAYGTDWLAFAHIVIGIAFWGPIKDPVRNIWVVEFGMIACVLVLPLALFCGPVREIPFYWQLIDCSFGVFGFIVLAVVHKMIRRLEWNQSSFHPSR